MENTIRTIKKSDIALHTHFPFRVVKGYDAKDVHVQNHAHDFFELVLFLDSQVELRSHSYRALLSPGSVFVMSPGERHAMNIPAGTSSYMINFAIELFDDKINNFVKIPGLMELLFYHFLPNAHIQFPCFCIRQETLDESLPLFEKLTYPPDFLTNSTLELYKKNLFLNILLLLSTEYHSQIGNDHTIPNTRLLTALLVIETHVHLESDTIAQHIYKCLDITKRYFFSFFKKHMSISLFDYIIKRKITISCSYLFSDKTVSEIAYSLGFYDTAHYSHCFKKVMNMSPSEYRHINTIST